MKSLLLIIPLLVISLFSFSQDKDRKMKQLKVTVFHSTSGMSRGYVYSISDSSLTLVREAAAVNNRVATPHYTSFSYNQINKMVVRRKGAASKGALIGAIIGGSAGIISGFISGDDPPCVQSNQDFVGIGYAFCSAFRTTAEQKAAMGGTAGALGGALLGVCIGAIVQKKFIIAGKKARYNDMQLSLLERLYIAKK
jgi:hypothetical protein